MKLYFLAFLTFCFTPGFSQLKVTQLNRLSLPKSLTFSGSLSGAVTWKDRSGTHFVLTTEVPPRASKEYPENKEAFLYAYHYLQGRDTPQLAWRVYDYVKECPVDIAASFVKKAFAVTDLDDNGEAEVWLMYKTACRGDISPANLKIIMYENGKKHAARGSTRVQLSPTQWTGGNYTLDEAFKTAHPSIRTFAKQLWQTHMQDTWN